MRPDCATCCFFRVVEAKDKHRRLCMLTGKRRPMAGMRGCQYLAGEWSQIDAILDLQKSRDCVNTELPNYTKLGSCFEIAKVKNTIDDFSVSPISHIAEKLKGSFTRPRIREDSAACVAGERVRLPFFCLKPNPRLERPFLSRA